MSGSRIGGHLREAREAAGLSSGDAAKRVAISPMTLSRYENDHRLPDAGALLSMAKVYGCDLVTLMTGAGAGARPCPIPVRGKMVDRKQFELDLKGEPKEFLPLLTDRPGTYAVRVVGSAMQPTYFNDDYLIMDMPEAEPFLEVSARGGGEGVQLVRGRNVGKVIGIFRKP